MTTRGPSRRRNGFSPPYSGAQICAWIALFLSYAQFVLFITPVLPLMATILATIYFTALVAAVIYYGGKTQLVDPVDVHLAAALRRDTADSDPYYTNKPTLMNRLYQQHNTDPTLEILPHETMKQCWICDTQVAEHSMHCKFCNKCVYHFDHHCMCKYQENYIWTFCGCICKTINGTLTFKFPACLHNPEPLLVAQRRAEYMYWFCKLHLFLSNYAITILDGDFSLWNSTDPPFGELSWRFESI